jgi:hypothetical protein
MKEAWTETNLSHGAGGVFIANAPANAPTEVCHRELIPQEDLGQDKQSSNKCARRRELLDDGFVDINIAIDTTLVDIHRRKRRYDISASWASQRALFIEEVFVS